MHSCEQMMQSFSYETQSGVLPQKGNITVDIESADGKVTDYTIHAENENIASAMNVVIKP